MGDNMEINLLNHKSFRKIDELTQIHGSIKWCVVFADGSHQYLYKIATDSTTQYCGSGGGYMKTHKYIYLAFNSETLKYERVDHLQIALDAFESKHGSAIWAQSQGVPQSFHDKYGTQR